VVRSFRVLALVVAVAAAGCAKRQADEGVSKELVQRTGYGIGLHRRPGDAPQVPDGIVVADGLSADEAAAIALWNNPALRADFARIQAAHADLQAARRPSNPSLRLLAPSGPMQFYVWFAWPIEAFVTMPKRIKLAKANLDAVAGQVVQTGLDLARDVRLAHVEWLLAEERVQARRDIAEGLQEVAKIAEVRAAAGDIPGSDSDAARGDALVAADEVARAEDDAAIAKTRLFALMAWRFGPDVRPTAEPPSRVALPQGTDFEALAVSSRPDLLSAQHAVEAAGERIGLEKLAVLRLTGIVYSTSGAGGPAGVQGGGELVLPIFNQNQGGIGRARADLEAATWRYHDLRNRIVADVTEAKLRLQQASRSLATYQETIVATREAELAAATASFELGEQSYLPVLLATGRLENAKLREVELGADVRRAVALLERAVGRRLEPSVANKDEAGR
jgi:cobalt-zinc-cadmium efflux system outer membrane protein